MMINMRQLEPRIRLKFILRFSMMAPLLTPLTTARSITLRLFKSITSTLSIASKRPLICLLKYGKTRKWNLTTRITNIFKTQSQPSKIYAASQANLATSIFKDIKDNQHNKSSNNSINIEVKMLIKLSLSVLKDE
jgi:hypothetical protein